jgi:membrane associated rhomboid family serine protease
MPPYTDPSASFPRPGKVVTVVMLLLGGLWLAFAVGMSWAGVPPEVFQLTTGNTLRILHGEVWRLFTASLVQSPTTFWHLFSVLLSLYFFAIPLESEWGPKRFVRFLLGLVLIPSLLQALVDLALPASLSRVMVPSYWYGGYAVTAGVTVAWALNNRASVIRLYGILPITPRMLIYMTLGWPALYLIFRSTPSEGIPAMYFGAGSGWLLGGDTPSPLRRYWLKYRMGRLDSEVAKEAAQRKKRVERSRLKVIEGGRAKPEPGVDGEKGRGPDGRWLN